MTKDLGRKRPKNKNVEKERLQMDAFHLRDIHAALNEENELLKKRMMIYGVIRKN